MAQTEDQRTDASLLARIRGGDSDALDTLLHRYYSTVFAFSYRITGNRSDAEDVCQDTLLKVARSIKQFCGQSKFTTWLYSIAINVTHDRRRNQHRQTLAQTGLKESISVGHPSHTLDESRSVIDALAVLTEKERDAFVLIVYEEMTHAEAGQILQCAETTVSWRMFTAKRKLLRFYEE